MDNVARRYGCLPTDLIEGDLTGMERLIINLAVASVGIKEEQIARKREMQKWRQTKR